MSDLRDEQSALWLRILFGEKDKYPDPFTIYQHRFVPDSESAPWSTVWYEPTPDFVYVAHMTADPENVVDADPPVRALLPEPGGVTREIVSEEEGREEEEERMEER